MPDERVTMDLTSKFVTQALDVIGVYGTCQVNLLITEVTWIKARDMIDVYE